MLPEAAGGACTMGWETGAGGTTAAATGAGARTSGFAIGCSMMCWCCAGENGVVGVGGRESGGRGRSVAEACDSSGERSPEVGGFDEGTGGGLTLDTPVTFYK